MDVSNEWKQVPTNDDDLLFASIQKTQNFTIKTNLRYRYRNNECKTVHMYVGPTPEYGCFSLSMPFAMKHNYVNKGQIAHLSSIKRVRECLHEPVSDDIWNAHSFPVEVMHRMIEIIRRDFSNIKFIKFEDDSQLECTANPLDKLDLLYYSVGVHGKTWYEQHFNAYFVPREKFIDYKCKLRDFHSKRTKSETQFQLLEDYIQTYGKDTAYSILIKHQIQLQEVYENTATFQEFFSKLNSFLPPKEDKCYLYKEWIKWFVIHFVGEIERKWVIDVYKFNPAHYGGGKKHYTRKHRRIAT